MKKLLIMMMVSCLMMLCSVGFAADDHKALGKQQQVAEKIMDAFDGEPVPLYAQMSAGFSANLKKTLNEEGFGRLQKQVKQKFGTMREARFVAFQRFDQVDRIIYVAPFTKERIVSIVFVFDKQNKLVEFSFAPMQQPEAKPAPAKK